MKNRHLSLGVALCLSVFWLLSCNRPATPGYVAYLVDTSKSFAPLDRSDLEALREISQQVTLQTINHWEHPVYFYWSAISSFSAGSSQLCGPMKEFYATPIPRADDDRLLQARDLREWHEACLTKLAGNGLQLADYTDLSGAIRAIADKTKGVKRPKVMVILSDFEEEQEAGADHVPFDVSGYSVIMAYRPARGSTSASTRAMYDRLDAFQSKLLQSGAGAVCRVGVGGSPPAVILPCLTLPRDQRSTQQDGSDSGSQILLAGVVLLGLFVLFPSMAIRR